MHIVVVLDNVLRIVVVDFLVPILQVVVLVNSVGCHCGSFFSNGEMVRAVRLVRLARVVQVVRVVRLWMLCIKKLYGLDGLLIKPEMSRL